MPDSDSVWPYGIQPASSTFHRILQARIQEWVSMPFSSGSFWTRDIGIRWTCLSCLPPLVGGLSTPRAAWEALILSRCLKIHCWFFVFCFLLLIFVANTYFRNIMLSLKDFEHYLASRWNDWNCTVVWTLFSIYSLGLKWKLTLSRPMAIAEFSKFAGILSATF